MQKPSRGLYRPVKLRLQNFPEGLKQVKWFEMKKKPVKIQLIEENGIHFVIIPEISAWNCGFISFRQFAD